MRQPAIALPAPLLQVSVKTTEAGGPRGYDAGKKIKGRHDDPSTKGAHLRALTNQVCETASWGQLPWTILPSSIVRTQLTSSRSASGDSEKMSCEKAAMFARIPGASVPTLCSENCEKALQAV